MGSFTVLIIPSLMVLFFIVIFVGSIKRVPKGEVWSVERLGRPTHRLSAGMHFIIPFIDKVSIKMRLDDEQVGHHSANKKVVYKSK